MDSANSFIIPLPQTWQGVVLYLGVLYFIIFAIQNGVKSGTKPKRKKSASAIIRRGIKAAQSGQPVPKSKKPSKLVEFDNHKPNNISDVTAQNKPKKQ